MALISLTFLSSRRGITYKHGRRVVLKNLKQYLVLRRRQKANVNIVRVLVISFKKSQGLIVVLYVVLFLKQQPQSETVSLLMGSLRIF